MPENRFNFSVELTGQGSGIRKTIVDPMARTVTSLHALRKKVMALEWDDPQKEAFMRYAGTYPEGSLDYLWKNMNHFLAVALKKYKPERVECQTAQPQEEVATLSIKKVPTAKEVFIAPTRPTLDVLDELEPRETVCETKENDDQGVGSVSGGVAGDSEGWDQPGGTEQILRNETRGGGGGDFRGAREAPLPRETTGH